MKAELTEGWWKALWDKKMEADPHKDDARVLAAIKAYKAALRGKSQTAVINALDALEKEFLASTARNLRKRKDLPEKDRLYLDSALGAALDLVDKRRDAATAAGAGIKTIYNIDFGTVIKRFHKGALFVDEKRPIEVRMLQLVIDELDALGAAPDLYRQIDQCVEKRAKEYIADIDDFFEKNAGQIDKKRFDAFAKKQSDAVVNELKADLERLPTDIMRRVRIHRDIAKKYRKERAVAVGKSVASTGFAAGGLAVPGSAPFAAVMLVRSIGDMSREIADTVISLKRKVKIFKGYLNELASAYESHKGEKEIARDTVNAVLGVDVVPTLDRAKAQLKNIEKDISSTLFRARQSNKKLVKLIETSDKLNRELNKTGIKPSVLKKTKLKTQLSLAERDISVLSDMVYRLMKHADYAEQRIPEMRRGLADIDRMSGRVEKAKVAIRSTLAIATTLGGVGDASAASQLANAAEKVGAIGLALEGTLETAKDLVDDFKAL